MEELLMDKPQETTVSPEGGEFDMFGLELSLRDRQALDGDFAGCVVSALESVKGTLLFKMEIEAQDAGRKVAAVSLGQGAAREFALVILPDGADTVRIERAGESDDPLAALVPSYAGLIDVLDIAA